MSIWWYLANMTISETTMKRFKHLAKAAKIVIAIPPSNAEQERSLSILQKPKTQNQFLFFPLMKGTLSGIY